METPKKDLTALEFALEIGRQQVEQIQKEIKPDFANLSIEDQKASMKAEAIFLYIKNFWAHYEFLSEKLGTEKDEDFHFFIPLLRTLIEIYGELLYWLNQDERSQIGIFTGHYLLNRSSYYRFLASKSVEIKNDYERTLNLWKPILDDQKVSFPADINQCSKKLLEKARFEFKKMDLIFQQGYFASSSSDTFALWEKDDASKFYDKYYRTFSDYTHRSFANQATGHTGTEKFWITQFLYLSAQLFIELCNKKVFSPPHQGQYDELREKIKLDYDAMIKTWDAKRSGRIEIKDPNEAQEEP